MSKPTKVLTTIVLIIGVVTAILYNDHQNQRFFESPESVITVFTQQYINGFLGVSASEELINKIELPPPNPDARIEEHPRVVIYEYSRRMNRIVASVGFEGRLVDDTFILTLGLKPSGRLSYWESINLAIGRHVDVPWRWKVTDVFFDSGFASRERAEYDRLNSMSHNEIVAETIQRVAKDPLRRAALRTLIEDGKLDEENPVAKEVLRYDDRTSYDEYVKQMADDIKAHVSAWDAVSEAWATYESADQYKAALSSSLLENGF